MKLILLIFIYPTFAFSYFLSTGTHVPYFGQAQISNSGATQKFEINPYIGIGTQYPIISQHYFTPEIGYVYYRENAKKTRTELIAVHYDFSYMINSQFVLRYGLTNNWYRIIGEGGNISLKNGNGYTSFPAPDETRTTYFTTLDLGLEYLLTNKQYALRFDMNIMSFAKLENKAYNYLLTFNFYL